METDDRSTVMITILIHQERDARDDCSLVSCGDTNAGNCRRSYPAARDVQAYAWTGRARPRRHRTADVRRAIAAESSNSLCRTKLRLRAVQTIARPRRVRTISMSCTGPKELTTMSRLIFVGPSTNRQAWQESMENGLTSEIRSNVRLIIEYQTIENACYFVRRS